MLSLFGLRVVLYCHHFTFRVSGQGGILKLYKMGCLKNKKNKEILLLISVFKSFVIFVEFQHICSDLLHTGLTPTLTQRPVSVGQFDRSFG